MKFPAIKYTLAATLSVAAVTAGTASAKFDDGPAASHYTPKALNALGQMWEAKARFYGRQSVSLRKKQAPAATPVSTSPPEGIEIVPGDESYSAPASCSYTHDEPC